MTEGDLAGLAGSKQTIGLLGLARRESCDGKKPTRYAGDVGDCRTEMAYGAALLGTAGLFAGVETLIRAGLCVGVPTLTGAWLCTGAAEKGRVWMKGRAGDTWDGCVGALLLGRAAADAGRLVCKAA
jgi:hypothetical protein